jgi:hypothetical protein
MKTKLAAVTILACFLLHAPALQAGPLIGKTIVNDGFPVEITVPRGQALTILSFTLQIDSRTPAQIGAGNVFVTAEGQPSLLVLSAAQVDLVAPDQGPSGRQITIPGPATVSVIVGGGSSGTTGGTHAYLVYKLMNNKH